MTITTNAQWTGRSLVTDDLFQRLTDRIIQVEGFERDFVGRILDQPLAFLLACAANDGAPLAPSELVHIGWHTFVLDTSEYAAFCDRIADRFIHHVPTDNGPAVESSTGTQTVLVLTIFCQYKSNMSSHGGFHRKHPGWQVGSRRSF
ncbi:hypothetical protein Amsp01_044070 [Amycolatopsis sp. NBRC 101858]|uniref:glycine-rich domain-containing protein n=1 Tax=Amycolatopsis sp. NBRC 101858 TaxID=3032200 RepID=UPI0024A3BA6B|nr:hypothetical protein [Amycolatopsis sp. NBRC 101858]GLY38383.1 hypothetical protein Amsp01_044070 [Amycolatopsis sp. NBRC 101858]